MTIKMDLKLERKRIVEEDQMERKLGQVNDCCFYEGTVSGILFD